MELFAGQLAVLPLFRGLTPLQVAAIARHAERVSYTPGATITEEDAVADASIVIISGTATRVSGPELVGGSEPVPQGSLIGEAAMLVETTYGSTIVARTAVRAVHITREALREQLLSDPAMAGVLAANLGQRLSKVAEILRRAEGLLPQGAPPDPEQPELAQPEPGEPEEPALQQAAG